MLFITFYVIMSSYNKIIIIGTIVIGNQRRCNFRAKIINIIISKLTIDKIKNKLKLSILEKDPDVL